jgi:hypothetical protein
MRAHLDAETTRLAAIWRITRKDGAQFFFTDHDRDIVFSGEVYRADAGFGMLWARDGRGVRDVGWRKRRLAGRGAAAGGHHRGGLASDYAANSRLRSIPLSQ